MSSRESSHWRTSPKNSTSTALSDWTKVFSYDSFLKNWGFYSSINYNPDWTYYELGTYKQLNIKFSSLVLMARYYNYGTVDGVLLSVRFRLFDTRYYCCHSLGGLYG